MSQYPKKGSFSLFVRKQMRFTGDKTRMDHPKFVTRANISCLKNFSIRSEGLRYDKVCQGTFTAHKK